MMKELKAAWQTATHFCDTDILKRLSRILELELKEQRTGNNRFVVQALLLGACDVRYKIRSLKQRLLVANVKKYDF